LFIYSLFEDKQEKMNNRDLFEKLKKYVQENEIDLSIFEKYNKELIIWLSLCIDNTERLNKLKGNDELLKAKGIKKEDLDIIINEISKIINKVSQEVPNIKNDNQEDFKNRLNNINNFFKFSSINVERIDIILDDPQNYNDSGFCLNLGDEIVIGTNSNNIDNFDHEFLHTQINRMIDSLEIDDDFIDYINKATSKSPLLDDYDVFSRENKSILYEEFIRTYISYFAKGISLQNKINELIHGLDKPEFAEKLRNSGKTKKDIINEFKDKNRLKFCIYAFFEEYSKQEDKTFEEYIEEFPNFVKQFYS